MNLAAVLTAKNSTHLSNLDIFDVIDVSVRNVFNVTAQRQLVTYQACGSFTTLSLECLNQLESTLQYLHHH